MAHQKKNPKGPPPPRSDREGSPALRLPGAAALAVLLGWIFWAGRAYFSDPAHSPGISAALSMIFETRFSLILGAPARLLAGHFFQAAWVLFFLFTAFHVGESLLRRTGLRDASPVLNAALSAGTGLFALSMTLFLLTAVRVLYAQVLLALEAALGMFALVRHHRTGRRFLPSFSFLARLKELSLVEKLLTLVLCAYLGTIASVILLPELFYDSLVYHLALPALWLTEHAFSPQPFLAFSTMPSLLQLNYAWGFAADRAFGFLHGDVLAKLLHFSTALLMTAALYDFTARRQGRAAGLLACLFLYAVPVITMNSWTSGNDVGTGFFQTLAVLCLILWREEGLQAPASAGNEPRPAGPWWLLSAFFCGAAFSSKYTAVFGAAATFLTAAALRFRGPGPWKERVRSVAVFAGVMGLVWSPWLIKNAVFTGNPLHPFLYNVLGAQNLSIEAASSITGTNPGAEFNLVGLFRLDFLWRFATSFRRVAMTGMDSVRSAGPMLLLFGPCLFFIKRWTVSLKIFASVFFLAYFFWFLGNEFARYLAPAYPCMAAALAMGWAILAGQFGRGIRQAVLLAPAAAAFLVWSPLALLAGYAYHPWEFLTGTITRDEYLSRSRNTYPNPSYLVYLYANRNLPPSPPTKVLLAGDNKAYGLERSFLYYTVEYNHPVLQTWVGQSRTGEDLYRTMRGSGITHIIINYREFIRLHGRPWNEKDRRVFDEFWKKHARALPVYAEGTALYELADSVPEGDSPLNLLLELDRRTWKRESLMNVFLERGLWDQAIDEASSWAALGSPVHGLLGDLYARRNGEGDLERAVAVYREGIRRNPADPRLYQALISIHVRRGEIGEARLVVRAGHAACPNDPDLTRLARTLSLNP